MIVTFHDLFLYDVRIIFEDQTVISHKFDLIPTLNDLIPTETTNFVVSGYMSLF